MNIAPLHVLLAAIAATGSGLGYLWWPDRDPWAPPAAKVPDAQTLGATRLEFATADPARLRETMERPLFAETRRPPPPPEPVKKEAPEPPDPMRNVRLHALISATDGTGVAIIQANGKMERVKVGSQFGPWTFQAIEGKKALFKRGGKSGRTTELVMVHLAPPAAAAAAPAAKAPAAAPDGSAGLPASDAPAPATAPPAGTPPPVAPNAAPASGTTPMVNGAPAEGLVKQMLERRKRREEAAAQKRANP